MSRRAAPDARLARPIGDLVPVAAVLAVHIALLDLAGLVRAPPLFGPCSKCLTAPDSGQGRLALHERFEGPTSCLLPG